MYSAECLLRFHSGEDHDVDHDHPNGGASGSQRGLRRYGGAMRDEPGSEVECSVGGTLPGGTTAGIPRDLSEGGC